MRKKVGNITNISRRPGTLMKLFGFIQNWMFFLVLLPYAKTRLCR